MQALFPRQQLVQKPKLDLRAEGWVSDDAERAGEAPFRHCAERRHVKTLALRTECTMEERSHNSGFSAASLAVCTRVSSW